MSAYAAPTEVLRDRELPRRSNSSADGVLLSMEDRVRASTALGDLLNVVVERVAEAVVARLDHTTTGARAEWLDTREAAEFLGIHRDTLRRLAAERSIPSEQDGPRCKLHFRRSELDAWRRSGGRTNHLTAVA